MPPCRSDCLERCVFMAVSSHVTCLGSVLLGEDRPSDRHPLLQLSDSPASGPQLESRHSWLEVPRTLGEP